MRIHVYSICWNEEILLPFYLSYYGSLAERIVVYDNMSDDRSPELIDAHPSCERRQLETGGETRDDKFQEIKNNVWKESRGLADWVIVCDIDEFVYHPNLLEYLASCSQRGITIPQPTGYQMVSDAFPQPGAPLWQQITQGRHSRFFSKKALFDPQRITEIGYKPGAHAASPTGEVIIEHDPNLKLLHYKFIGGVDWHVQKTARRESRLGATNRKYGWGATTGIEKAADEFRFEKQAARPVRLQSHSSRKKVVLFVTERATDDDILRTAALAVSLDSNAFDVAIACDFESQALIHDLGVRLVPLKSALQEPVASAENHTKITRALLLSGASLEGCVQDDLHLMEQQSPDVIIGTLRPSLALSCRSVDIPLVTIVDSQHSYLRKDQKAAEQLLAPLLVAPIPSLYALAAGSVMSIKRAAPLHFTRLKYGLGLSLDERKALGDGDHIAYPDIPGIFEMSALPQAHVLLGPVLQPDAANSNADFWRRLPQKQVVYVCLRDTTQAQLRLLVLEALKPLSVSVVIADGVNNNLMRDCSLAICDGGSFTGQQALAAGVPILALVQTGDQIEFASAIKERGAGEIRFSDESSAGDLQRQIWRMLMKRSYRDRARELGEKCKGLNAAATLATLLDHICEKALSLPAPVAAGSTINVVR